MNWNKKKRYFFLLAIIFIFGTMYLHIRGQRELLLGYDDLQWSGGYRESNYQVFDETTAKGTVCRTYDMALSKGNYVIRVLYSEQFVPNIVRLSMDGQRTEYELPVEQTVYEFPVALPEDVRKLNLSIDYQQTGKLTISGIEVIGSNLLYTDTIFWMLVLIIGSVLFYFFSDKYLLSVSADQKLSMILLCCALFVSCIPLMGDSMLTGHDIGWHFQRIEGIKDALQAGSFPVRIAPNENEGYGLLLTQYPFLFLYLPAILRIFNISIIGSYKIFILLINAATMFTAYFCVKSICIEQKEEMSNFNNEKHWLWGSTLAAISLCLFPYRIINVYTRAAIGESLAMIFLPVLITGLYHILVGNRRKWFYVVIGATGVINSHIISIILAVIVSSLILVIWCRQLLIKERAAALLKAGALTILLNCFYLVPFLYYYFNNATKVNDILSTNYVQETLMVRELFISGSTTNAEGLLNPALGAAGLICIIVLITLLFVNHCKMKGYRYEFMISLFVLMILFLVMSTSLMPYRQLTKIGVIDQILSTLQFTYRFISVATVLFALLMGTITAMGNEIVIRKRTIAFIVFGILILGALHIENSSKNSIDKIQYLNWEYIDYIPAGADNNKLSPDLFVSSDALLTQYVKNGNKIEFEYISNCEDDYVELPLYFYPGYVARDADGNHMPVERGENARIRIPLDSSKKPEVIRVFYEEPLLFKIAGIISGLTLVGCIGVYWKSKAN